MLSTANRNGTRLLTGLAAIFMLSATAPALRGQVRFSGTEAVVEEPPVATRAERQNPFRSQPHIQQAQFQELPPQVPDAANEAANPGAVRSAPPSNGGAQATPGSPGQAETIQPGPTMQGTPSPVVVEEFIDSSFDPGYVEQDSAEFYSTNNTFRRGYWYSHQEFVAFLRTEGEDVPISADQSDVVFDPVPSTGHRPVITSKTTDHTYEPGVRLTLGRFLGQDVANRDHSVEFTFLGLFEFESEAAIRSVELPGFLDTALGAFKTATFGFGIIGNNPIPGFSGALEHSTIYKTDMNSFEMNYRMMGRPLRDRIAMQPNGSWVRHGTASSLKTFIFGGRFMSINEDFKYFSEFLDTEQDSGYLNVRTRNDMLGIHGGFEIQEAYTNWSWGLRGKFGGLYNFADRRSFLSVVDDGEASQRQQELTKNNMAASIEAGLVANYKLRTNLNARVSYDAMYITGIATAPENLGLEPEWPNFEVTGDVLYHGLSVGFEMLW